jgi:tRNA A37 threonylcarbamoyltransferase TsaD
MDTELNFFIAQLYCSSQQQVMALSFHKRNVISKSPFSFQGGKNSRKQKYNLKSLKKNKLNVFIRDIVFSFEQAILTTILNQTKYTVQNVTLLRVSQK